MKYVMAAICMVSLFIFFVITVSVTTPISFIMGGCSRVKEMWVAAWSSLELGK